jgi:hypothetical protein
MVHSDTYPGSGGPCTVSASDPRCNPTVVQWSNASPAISYSGSPASFTSTCSYSSTTGPAQCTGTYTGSPSQITVTGLQSNGAMALRQVNTGATAILTWSDPDNSTSGSSAPLPSISINGDGTFTVSASGAFPAASGLTGVTYSISVPGNSTSDHPILDSRTSSPTGWFLRNEWHKLVYYAFAPGYAASTAAPRACTTGSTCLSVANVTLAGAQRAILILTGRSINGSARPSATLTDYLEFGNANGAFERQTVTPTPPAAFADTGTVNAYVVSAASPTAGSTLLFSASNSNTGASTLTTSATGLKNLVNLDGSNLAASTIQANAAVQVTYDGSQFLLSKRPFNDRIVVIGSN